jgi:hypothetical protein
VPLTKVAPPLCKTGYEVGTGPKCSGAKLAVLAMLLCAFTHCLVERLACDNDMHTLVASVVPTRSSNLPQCGPWQVCLVPNTGCAKSGVECGWPFRIIKLVWCVLVTLYQWFAQQAFHLHTLL